MDGIRCRHQAKEDDVPLIPLERVCINVSLLWNGSDAL
jgi:hypothetical protein